MFVQPYSWQYYSQQSNVEATEVSIDWWKNRQSVAYTHNGIVFILRLSEISQWQKGWFYTSEWMSYTKDPCFCAQSHLVVSDSAIPWTIACQASLSMGFPGKNTGVGCHSILQGIFPTQRSNPHLLHWQADSTPVSYLRSPYEGSRVVKLIETESWMVVIVTVSDLQNEKALEICVITI